MSIKHRLQNVLYKIRHPERDENEAAFYRNLGFKRLLFILPFLIAAAIFILLSLK